MTAKKKPKRERLRPCPFCGHAAQINRMDGPLFEIMCANLDCGVNVETSCESSAELVASMWNTRRRASR